jgi:hypothetical protein
MKHFVLLLASSFIFYFSNAQNVDQNINGIGIASTYGKVLKHTEKLYHIPTGPSFNIEANYTNQNFSKEWSKLFGYPIVGSTVSYIDYKDSILGKAISVMPNIQFELFKINKISAFIRVGAGISFSSNYWKRNPVYDTINNYVSTPLNMYASVLTGLQGNFNKKYYAQLGYAISHISNGGSRKPNFGINLIGTYLTIGYRPIYHKVKEENSELQKKVSSIKKPFGMDLNFGVSSATYGTIGGSAQVPIYTAGVKANYNYRNKHLLFVGINYEYNGKSAFYLRTHSIAKNNLWNDAGFLNCIFGTEFKIGAFGLPLQVGLYTQKKYLQSNTLFQKFGILYYPFRNTTKKSSFNGIYLGPLLKVNNFNADFIELNIGYRLESIL